MKTGLVKPNGYSSTYPTNIYSPGVWDTCPGSDLEQLAQGYFFQAHYNNGLHPTALTFIDANSTTASGQAYYNSSTNFTNGLSTNSQNAVGHIIQLTPGSTTAASYAGRVAITSRPTNPITPGGLPVWFETALTITTASTQECGMFVGLVTLPALSTAGTTGCILKTITATASTNALAASTGAIGFWMHGDTPNNFDCVYANQYNTGLYSTSTGVQVVLANALTSSTGTIVPGTVYSAPVGGTTPPGILTSTQVVKLGIKFLPQVGQIQWYVNGYQVAAAAVTPSNSTAASTGLGFDVINAYGGIVVLGGSTSTTSALVDFFVHASQQLY